MSSFGAIRFFSTDLHGVLSRMYSFLVHIRVYLASHILNVEKTGKQKKIAYFYDLVGIRVTVRGNHGHSKLGLE